MHAQIGGQASYITRVPPGTIPVVFWKSGQGACHKKMTQNTGSRRPRLSKTQHLVEPASPLHAVFGTRLRYVACENEGRGAEGAKQKRGRKNQKHEVEKEESVL